MSFPLEVDGVTTRATTDVEDATADFLHRRAFDLRPLRGRGEVRFDERAAAVPIISLELEDDLLAEPMVKHRLRVEIERGDRLAFPRRTAGRHKSNGICRGRLVICLSARELQDNRVEAKSILRCRVGGWGAGDGSRPER